MKLLAALLALMTLATFSTARANDATCMDGHEDQAGTLVKKQMIQLIAVALRKKGIALDMDKSTFDLSTGQIIENYDGAYGYFQIADGSLVSKDGTTLTVEFKSASYGNTLDDAQTVYLKPQLKSKGFDKEGNAINGHCTLITDEVSVTDRADTILVTNAHTARELARVALPKTVVLY